MGRRYRGSFIRATAPTTSNASPTASGVWTLEQQMQAQQANQWPGIITGICQSYTVAGNYSFVVPAGVTSISAVALGAGGSGSGGRQETFGGGTYYCCFWMQCEYCPGGQLNYSGGGGGGGGLSYRNNYSVSAGQTLLITVGAANSGSASGTSQASVSGSCLFVRAYGACNGTSYSSGGNPGYANVGNGGSNGGSGGTGFSTYTSGRYPAGGGGGGAAGYYNNGGTGGYNPNCVSGYAGSGSSGSGGGGGGGGGMGSGNLYGFGGGGGGGTGLLGGAQVAYSGGAAGGTSSHGGGGTGSLISGGTSGSTPGAGGLYGAGGGGGSLAYGGSGGGTNGAVRIVAPGTTRQFPNTNVS